MPNAKHKTLAEENIEREAAMGPCAQGYVHVFMENQTQTKWKRYRCVYCNRLRPTSRREQSYLDAMFRG